MSHGPEAVFILHQMYDRIRHWMTVDPDTGKIYRQVANTSRTVHPLLRRLEDRYPKYREGEDSAANGGDRSRNRLERIRNSRVFSASFIMKADSHLWNERSRKAYR